MAPSNGEIISSNFPQFDIVSAEPSDHVYLTSSTPSTNARTAFHKKIMQEWKILDANLPETIFVRVYETRISLLRAAIIGAPGTPYHDGLFFFDILLPSDYPIRPPRVYYHSFGFRINPNLYASGKVCLSLLNTWFGNKSEKWDSNQSTILQVLLSIQALVLNEKPYFNEPYYSTFQGKTEWEKTAALYNEDVFVLCCKSALHLLRKPPANFQALVTSHFLERGLSILTACDAYRSGKAIVGGNVPLTNNGGRFRLVSTRFKAVMGNVYGELVQAFGRNGVSVEQFVKQLADEKVAEEMKAKRKQEEARKKQAEMDEEARMRREKRKKAREDMKKKVMAFVEKILVGTGLKNSSVGNEEVKVMN